MDGRCTAPDEGTMDDAVDEDGAEADDGAEEATEEDGKGREGGGNMLGVDKAATPTPAPMPPSYKADEAAVEGRRNERLGADAGAVDAVDAVAGGLAEGRGASDEYESNR